MPRFISALSLTLFVLLASSFALADDLNAPFYRGLFRSTSAEWDFDTSGTNPLQPDGDEVPLVAGDFKPQLDAEFGGSHPNGFANGLTYDAVNEGWRNLGTSEGTLAFNVPNWIDEEPVKFLRLQVTYQGDAPSTAVFGVLGLSSSAESVVEINDGRFFDEPPLGSYFYEDWRCLPNPDWEQVVLFVPPGTFIDQVVIDTISVPEPAAALLLGLMSLFVGRRRAA